VYAYVPFASLNTIVAEVDGTVVPFSVTDHVVPEGSPVSVNVTVYIARGGPHVSTEEPE
jgi:hypothetical protein